MAYLCRTVSWQQRHHTLKALRERVFVCEYHIPPDVEFDQEDTQAKHIVIIDDSCDTPVATARLCQDGLIGRAAVLRGHRNKHLFNLMFQKLAVIAKKQGLQKIAINCVLQEVDRFTQVGFEQNGHVFMEAGIARQRLVCPIDKFTPEPFTLVH